ncbi:MAG: hypothetical protein CPSOU_1816 [uncultured Paraburkholderia sp.]|nr:MAG: hypothetical protein CPSOU_1816 [uncultured Paraburkholderia sp.]
MTMFETGRRIYISGPMSDLPNLNWPLFNRTAVHLRNMRWEVVNPVEVNNDPAAPWLRCIAADLQAMEGCTAICLLPGWEKSFGAQIEHLAAQKEGMSIYKLEDLIPEAA